MAKNDGKWQDSKLIARGILSDRTQRRKFLANLLFGVLGMMVIGLWLIDDWLATSPWYFLLWWLICAILTALVILFAIYDMLAVIREERGPK